MYRSQINATGRPAGTAHAARTKVLAPFFAYCDIYWYYAVLNLFEGHPTGAPAGRAARGAQVCRGPYNARIKVLDNKILRSS
jgi:hypothetical protein